MANTENINRRPVLWLLLCWPEVMKNKINFYAIFIDLSSLGWSQYLIDTIYSRNLLIFRF